MLIREARPEDKQELLQIVRLCWDQETARRADIELDQAFRGYDWRPVLYVAQGGGVIGCAAFIASWTYFGVYDITWVNVLPMAQRCGAGKALIERCLEGIRPLGHLAMLSTHIPEYYEKHWGFKRLHRHGDDQVVMALDL